MARYDSASDDKPRVINFRRRGLPAGGSRAPFSAPSPVEDLAKYQHSEGDDDYRHRMLINAAAFLFVLVLMAIGLWLAETMAEMRRHQDCALTGRNNCVPIEVKHSRW
jgi:hypothetical protein